ncbi:MAG TPA: PIG-L family deacetylase [Vicinamibacterales bacterium]|nr:PIG-L family deacetylase [Vicinamibacterales bacterium]
MALTAARFDGQVVLAVFAHPDDESLAAGGTLARLGDEGAHVVVMCATHGECGSGLVDGGPTLARRRTRELQVAAEMLGVHELVILNHRDGDLRWTEMTHFTAELAHVIDRRRPSALITFDQDGLYWHPDHLGVHERVLSAVREFGTAAPPVYGVTLNADLMTEAVGAATARGWRLPPGGFWRLAPDVFGKYALPPSVVVDVSDWVPRKVLAICAHETQMGQVHPFSNLSADDARRWLGREFFRRLEIPSNGATLIESLCTPTS